MSSVNDISLPIRQKTEEECIPNNVVRDSSGNPIKLPSGLFLTSGEEILDPGPQISKNQVLSLNLQVPKHVLASVLNPDPPAGIGRLSRLHVKAIKTMIANATSGFSYRFIGPANYVGKYQLSAVILTDLGYIKSEYVDLFGSDSVKKASAWTNKDGVGNLESYFRSEGVQENSMFDLLEKNYQAMEKNGAIKADDNLCTIAGMLCVAHILGPELGTELDPGAKRWRNTGSGKDVNGNYGTVFFLLGRYAIDVLARVN
jgi:hypothetical protein